MSLNSLKLLGGTVEEQCCSEKCLTEISEEVKNKFCRDYSLCKSFESQSVFIVNNVHEKPVLNGKKKKYTRSYYIHTRQVCFRSFRQILGISETKIALALEKNHAGSLDDLRRGGNHNLLSSSRKQIIDHINSFPHYVSHYRREVSDSLYLDPELNTATMYRLFKEKWVKDNPNIRSPCINTYVKIFGSMGLKFKNLKTDTCKSCDRFQNQLKAATVGKNEIEIMRVNHWDKAAALREQMKEDFATGKSDPRVFISFKYFF